MVRHCLASTAQVRQILGEIQRATNTAVLSTEEVTKGVAQAGRVAAQAGATIKELNIVRKHLEVLKGGGLARLLNVMNDGGLGHAVGLRLPRTNPLARAGSTVICEQCSALSSRCRSNRG